MSQVTEEEVDETTDDVLIFMRHVVEATKHVSIPAVMCGAIAACAFIHLKAGINPSKETFLQIVGDGFDAVAKDVASGKRNLQ